MSKEEKKPRNLIYVHSIETIWSENGEVYAQTDNKDIIVFHGENLFNDIPSLMTMDLKERRKQEELTLELIEDELNKMKKAKESN